LDHCLEKRQVPTDVQKFRLRDQDSEQKIMLGLNLEGSLTRAKVNARKLLKEWQIFCTPNLQGGWDIYKEIVEVNGGQCLVFKNRMKMTVKKRGQEDSQEEMQKLFLVSGTSAADKALWEDFREMASGADMEPVIVGSEWLLMVAMTQDTDVWRDDWRLG
jgi:hypothetical protein